MRIFKTLILILFVGLFVAACSNNATEEAPPTLMEIQNNDAQATDAPTATVDAAEDVATPEATNTQRPSGRPTLPPTWTPPFTETPAFTPTQEINRDFASEEPPVAVNTLPPQCANFTWDRANTDINFFLGESPTVAWTAIEGAVRYRVTLVDERLNIIRDDIYVAETSYTFAADLFEENKLYAWDVYPINAANIQMCDRSGAELIPARNRQ